MTRTLMPAALLALLLVLLAPVPAVADTGLGAPGVTEAQAWIVEDSTGRVLAESNADAAFAPASITKVMTAMVALDAGLPMDTEVAMPAHPEDGWEAAQVAGYAVGETSTLEDMLEVLLVYSANDVGYAIAEKVAGSQGAFADLMNEKAAEIGMTRTTFKNPHGLEEDGHESCARDLALMGRYALTHYPFIARMVRTHSVTVPSSCPSTARSSASRRARWRQAPRSWAPPARTGSPSTRASSGASPTGGASRTRGP